MAWSEVAKQDKTYRIIQGGEAIPSAGISIPANGEHTHTFNFSTIMDGATEAIIGAWITGTGNSRIIPRYISIDASGRSVSVGVSNLTGAAVNLMQLTIKVLTMKPVGQASYPVTNVGNIL